MTDVTQRFNLYRECVRSLWNNFFLRSLLDEDSIDDAKQEYDDICVNIFSSLVLNPIGAGGFVKSKSYQLIQNPIDCFVVKPLPKSGTTIHINREINKSSGYWDYQANRIPPDDIYLLFIDCFDFGQYGYRDMEYYLVMVSDSLTNKDLIGRNALIKACSSIVCYDPK